MIKFVILISLLFLVITQNQEKLEIQSIEHENISVSMNQKNITMKLGEDKLFETSLSSLKLIKENKEIITIKDFKDENLEIIKKFNTTLSNITSETLEGRLNYPNEFSLKLKLDYFFNKENILFSNSGEKSKFVNAGNLRLMVQLFDFDFTKNPGDLLLTLNLQNLKRKYCYENSLKSAENCLFEKGQIFLGQALRNVNSTDYGKLKIIPKIDKEIIIPFGNFTKNAIWEAIFDLDFQSTEETPVEFELVNRIRHFENSIITTNYKGGEVSIMDKNKNNQFNISIFKIEEVNGNGYLIGDGENLSKHRLYNFSAINFETNYQPGKLDLANLTKMGLRTDFNYNKINENSPKLIMEIMSFENKQNISNTGNNITINKDDILIEFNLDLNNWDFCRKDKKNCLRNNTIEEYDNTEYLDFTFLINSNEVSTQNKNGNENFIINKYLKYFVENTYSNNDKIIKYPNDYPKINFNGTKVYYTVRFAIQEKNEIKCSNFINLLFNQNVLEEGNGVLIIISIIIFLLILLIGIMLYLRKSSRKSSIMIDSDRIKNLENF